jgi:hypothetical protein
MPFCENCGKHLDTSANSCIHCNHTVEVPGEEPVPDYKNKTFIKLSENEVQIKTYHCTTLKKPSGEGYIAVTNKRVIFYGYGTSSKLVSEVPIETVSGISFYFGYGIRLLFIILGVLTSLMFLGSLNLINSDSALALIPLVFLAAAILLFVYARRPCYNLSIFSTGANGTPINIGNGTLGTMAAGQGAVFTVAANPTSETETMMDELGALILDLKTMGDHAIAKWLGGGPDLPATSGREPRQSTTDEEFFS